MVEQHPFKLLVPGSNPGQPTTDEPLIEVCQTSRKVCLSHFRDRLPRFVRLVFKTHVARLLLALFP